MIVLYLSANTKKYFKLQLKISTSLILILWQNHKSVFATLPHFVPCAVVRYHMPSARGHQRLCSTSFHLDAPPVSDGENIVLNTLHKDQRNTEITHQILFLPSSNWRLTWSINQSAGEITKLMVIISWLAAVVVIKYGCELAQSCPTCQTHTRLYSDLDWHYR